MKRSAGVLLYKHVKGEAQVLLVHPGGPFWAKKDLSSWSIPKGEFIEGEDPKAAAQREFREELGVNAPDTLQELGSVKVPGKEIFAWFTEAALDTKQVKSNMFEMEWPPRSGKTELFPEVDRAGWFTLAEAAQKIVKGQVPLLEQLAVHLGATMEVPEPPKKKEQTSLF
jgi:predicted NUDIX family NTP pyrophosphohydrolase